MREDIIEKLTQKCFKSNLEESDVVYMLVEIYKVLEKENNLDDFWLVRFYRNWCCHCELVGGPVPEFFKEVKAEIDSGRMGEGTFEKFPRILAMFSFEKLKESLGVFIKEYLNLDLQTLNWVSFRNNLYKVIVDQPLKTKLVEGTLIFKYTKLIADQEIRDDLEIEISFHNIVLSGSYNDTHIKNL